MKSNNSVEPWYKLDVIFRKDHHQCWRAPSHQPETGTLWRSLLSSRGSGTMEEWGESSSTSSAEMWSNGNKKIINAREPRYKLDVSLGWTSGLRIIHRRWQTSRDLTKKMSNSREWPGEFSMNQTMRRSPKMKDSEQAKILDKLNGSVIPRCLLWITRCQI